MTRLPRWLFACGLLLAADLSAAERLAAIGRGWEYLLVEPLPDTASAPERPPPGDWRVFARQPVTTASGLWLRRKLPDIGSPTADLVISVFVPRFAVYLDGAAVYDYRKSASRRANELAIHVVPLPAGYAGKRLAIWIPRAAFHSFEVTDPFLAAPDSVPSVMDLIVNRQLRRDLPNGAIGVLTIAAGLAILALFFVRRRGRDLALIYLAGLALPYGARLLMDSQWISFAIGAPTQFWRWPVAIITYLIGIPCLLLARSALGGGWKSSLTWALRVQIVFSAAAIIWDTFRGTPFAAERVNGLWALAFTVIVLANLFTRPLAGDPGLRALGIGFLVFTAAVINANIGALGLPDWRPAGIQLEPYAFFVLFACFGYYVAVRAITREEKLRSVEQELETARRIQRSILPSAIPAVERLDIAARYVPMTAVAGDFYDFAVVDENRIGILVADVSGHGVPAALVASMVKVAFAGQARHASDPAIVLSGMNEVLHGRVQRQFVTAVYVFIDSREGSLTYASAGHPWPLLRRAAANTIEALKQGGLVLGPFRKTAYTNTRIDLHPGDTLLLYTDGIVEAANAADEFYGDHSLQAFLSSRRNLDPERFTDELLQDVRAWSKTQNDDITLVAANFAARTPAHRKVMPTVATRS